AVPVLDCIESDLAVANISSGDSWYDDMCLEGAQLFKRTNLQYPDLTEESDAWLSVVPKIKRGRDCGAKEHPLATQLNKDDYNVTVRSEALQKVFQDISKRLKDAYQRSRQHYNLRKRNDRFHLQQRVWKRSYVISDATKGFTSKLAPKFDGPYTIVKVLSPWSYELADDTGKSRGVWHAKDIKAHPPDD
ncbi:hypothetical protein NQ317_018943, partial [Molorchus minor]